MYWTVLSNGALIGLLASIPLGPIGVLCIQRTLQRGRVSGFATGMGAAFSDTLYAVIAGFSLSFIVQFVETQMFWLQFVGSAVLFLLGWHIFRSNPAVQLRRRRKMKVSLFQDFFTTFLLTITNPMALFLFIAFFAGLRVVDASMQLVDQFCLIVGVFLGATFWWFTVTFIVGFFRSVINLRRLFWINRIAGATIMVLVLVAVLVFIGQSLIGS